MFAISGAGLSKIRHMNNGGKRARHSLDQWDRQSEYMCIRFALGGVVEIRGWAGRKMDEWANARGI